jgi:hypothetical protein
MKFEVVCMCWRSGVRELVTKQTRALDEGNAYLKVQKQLQKKYDIVQVRGVNSIY